MDESALKGKKVAELREIAKTFGLKNYQKMKKAELVQALMKDDEPPKKAEQAGVDKAESVPSACFGAGADTAEAAEKSVHAEPAEATSADAAETSADKSESAEHAGRRSGGRAAGRTDERQDGRQQRTGRHRGKPAPDRSDRFEVEGILELADGGFGFLRFNNFLTSEKDIYVAPAQIRRFNLKTGDKVKGICRHPNDGDKFGALLYVVKFEYESKVQKTPGGRQGPFAETDRPCGAYRQRPARPDRRTAEGRKDRAYQEDREQHRKKLPGRRDDRPARRRAS